MTLDQFLVKIRLDAGWSKEGDDYDFKSTKLGFDFEKAMVEFFKYYEPDGSESWLTEIKRWHDMYQETDTGIDIVAKDRDGELVGIQCKCWGDNQTLSMQKLGTMFVTAKAKKIDKLIVVFTGESLTEHAQTRCEESGVQVIMRSDLSRYKFNWNTAVKKQRHEPLSLKPHQAEAVSKTVTKFKDADRGQLIMACGTGKTLTSLHIAEKTAGRGGLVLYLVPSISLIPQAMREWAENRSMPHRYIAVCSDKTAGNDEEGSITEIPITPSTNVKDLQKEYARLDRKNTMSVVFSTYNSVAVASEALLKHDKNAMFDLILFDEAHKTTGVEKITESYYQLAHNNLVSGKDGVPAKKRLYMTATPRVYKRKPTAKKMKNGRRVESELKVYSMDSTSTYGDEFYRLDFSDAVKRGLLSTYKIIMRKVDKGDMYGKFIESGQDTRDKDDKDYGDLDLDYMAKLGGILKAITYPDDSPDAPPKPLQRVMVFHNQIKKSKMFAAHGLNQDVDKKPLKVDKTTRMGLSFDNLSKRLLATDSKLAGYVTHTRHVDGTTNSRNRGERIDWLRKSDTKPTEIRILSNARCLQEGVDVPALDAVAFMDPKKSPIDIIQSIGRVMRKGNGKNIGYVIIPIPVLEGDNPKSVLDRNKKYEQVNGIIQAILAHDDKLRAILNNQMLSHSSSSKKRKPADVQEITPQLQEWLEQTIVGDIDDELLEEIKIILLELGDSGRYKKVGAELGEQSVIIEEMLKQQIKIQPKTAKIIGDLHKNLQSVVGSTITLIETVKALAQHAVMNRVFVTLFPGYENPVASAFNKVLDKIDIRHQLKSLENYYQVIAYDIEQFETPEQKQEFIRIIYDSFFRGADKKASIKHGIVYTPIEIVDFIINSVQHVLQTEFGKSFDDRCVKILDPFTGTGTFITRLLESGMISQDNLYAKYKNDIYANEIMLPAYYVAMANIETSYQKMKGSKDKMGKYVPFDGISYMDTFDQHPLYRLEKRYREKQLQLTDLNLKEAQARTRRQGMDAINVIFGNPPYMGGQETADQDNAATRHTILENRIKNTYTSKAREIGFNGAILKPNNAYFKALRWASDRIENSGIIGFITPSAYITGNSEVGVRTCVQQEFTDVWVFNLLGQKGMKGHGRNIFEYPGSNEGGTTVGVAIIILVKNQKKRNNKIYYYQLPELEYQGEQKRSCVQKLKSIENIKWKLIKPDKHNDWLNQRGDTSEQFEAYTPMGSKESRRGNTNKSIFKTYSNGIKTNRDAWVYNSINVELKNNIKKTIEYCNKQNWKDADKFEKNEKNIAWTIRLSENLKHLEKPLKFDKTKVRTALYRPFIKQYLYFDKLWNEVQYHIPSFFPNLNVENSIIMIPDKTTKFSTMITDTTPDLEVIHHGQCFPFKTKKHIDTHTHTHTHSNLNLCILVPDKIKSEFSVFITNLIPDLHILETSQVFPFRVRI